MKKVRAIDFEFMQSNYESLLLQLEYQKQSSAKYKALYYEYRRKYLNIVNKQKPTIIHSSESERLILIISEFYKIDLNKENSRLRLVVSARYICFWFAITKLGVSLYSAGAMFDRDHATAYYGSRRICDMLDIVAKNPKLRQTRYKVEMDAIEYLNEQWYGESNNTEDTLQLQSTESNKQE
ncbi:MAG: hypothetical protein MJ197_08720 [Bacteroidales bacterium]|nr:hypothetical protein [Bacteroidales bacterium]